MLLFLFTVYMADDDNIEMKNKKRVNIAKNKNRNQLSHQNFVSYPWLLSVLITDGYIYIFHISKRFSCQLYQ